MTTESDRLAAEWDELRACFMRMEYASPSEGQKMRNELDRLARQHRTALRNEVIEHRKRKLFQQLLAHGIYDIKPHGPALLQRSAETGRYTHPDVQTKWEEFIK